MARTMMLHASIHWPEMSDPSLWPMAVAHAVFLYNHVPQMDSGLSPIDLFTKTRWEQRKFHDLHVWGCPVYVLDKTLSDGKKLPRWKPRSKRTIHMGSSPMHASTVPLVLNPDSGAITAVYHIVFDDWFATIAMSEPPPLDSDEWNRLFGDSVYQYVFDENDDAADTSVPTRLYPTHRDTVAQAIDASQPATPLLVESPALLPSRNDVPAVARKSARNNFSPTEPGSMEAQPVPRPLPPLRTGNPDVPRKLLAPTTTTQPSVSSTANEWTEVGAIRHRGRLRISKVTELEEPPPLRPRSPSPPRSSLRELHPRELPPREPSVPASQLNHRRETKQHVVTMRQTRSSTGSLPARQPRYGYDPTQGHGYVAVPTQTLGLYTPIVPQPKLHMVQCFEHRLIPTLFLDSGCATPAAYKASVSDPDTLTYDQAMADKEHLTKWMEAAQKEISTLESLGSWDEVDVSDAQSRIIPGTWVFRVK